MDQTQQRNTPTGISRRTLVKGAAWAVPVIAVAAATPMAAASGTGQIGLAGLEAAWDRRDNSAVVPGETRVPFLRLFFQITAPWVPTNSPQTKITNALVTFKVDNAAVASPLQAVTVEPTTQTNGVWTFSGARPDTDPNFTLFDFAWTGSLDPQGGPFATEVRWATRAGAAAADDSGFSTIVTAIASSTDASGSVTQSDDTGVV